jgi:hypothetical protein
VRPLEQIAGDPDFGEEPQGGGMKGQGIAARRRPLLLVDDLDADALFAEENGGEEPHRPGTDDQHLGLGIQSVADRFRCGLGNGADQCGGSVGHAEALHCGASTDRGLAATHGEVVAVPAGGVGRLRRRLHPFRYGARSAVPSM